MALHLLSGVFVAVILFWSTCAHAATSLNSLALVLNGPDVANYGSTVVFKCSWQADDLVFRILWRIQLAGSSVPLEYTLKNAAQSEPVSLSNAGSDGPLQGEASVDTRNNFSTLTLRNVSFVDGLYTCVVSSVTAEKLTNKSLRVVAPPDQIISRVNLTHNNSSFLTNGSTIGPYLEGTGFEINCFVAWSRPPAKIIWYRKDLQGQLYPMESQSGPQKQQMEASGGWRVSRSMYFRLDSRRLMGNVLICQAENEATSQPVQTAYRLDMLVPPTNISLSSLNGVQLREGLLYQVNCTVWNAKPFATITWTLDREPISRFIVNDTLPGETEGTFSTRSVFTYSANPDDNGKALSCIATQEVLTVQRRGMSNSTILNVVYSPRNVMTSKSHLSLVEWRLPETDTLGGINCTADANPPAQYVWMFKESVIATGPTLVFGRNVTLDDAGDYFCIASNEVGQTNISMQVDVQYRPYCSRCANASDPCLIGAAMEQSQSVTCDMDASPAADLVYMWNVPLNETTTDNALAIPTNLDTSSSSSASINYTVRSSDDYHALACWARNSIGLSEQPCYFRVVPAGPPHPPENCSIITVMSSGFSLKCRPGFDGGHPQKFVMSIWATGQDADNSALSYKISPSTSNKALRSQDAVVMPDVRENVFPEWLEKGLQGGKDYRVKIVSRNEAGNSQPVFLALRTLKPDDSTIGLSTTVVAAIAGSLGGFAFLILLASVAFLCVRRRKKGESVGSGSETHSNNSSNDGSKSELVKGPNSNGVVNVTARRPDTLTSKSADSNGNASGNGSNGHLYHQTVIQSKKDHPVTEVTYTRACDLQSKKLSVKPVLGPKPPLVSGNGVVVARPVDRTQYAVIDVSKSGKRAAPRPSEDMVAHDGSPLPNRTNDDMLQQEPKNGILKTVAVV
ncbi:hypothetical protein RvY_01299-2 [Ramazzottius varieornatus]|uniref:Ig-like domain-containing protein n=1 Tax=Ramazzottius varieornatus TaxID=947166 RepID=A0A1D1UR36_RAMVA|nr:hypothetical protein RvY_01299-2 [Ramazzottius varieornatus]